MTNIEKGFTMDFCPAGEGASRTEAPDILEVKILAPEEFSCEEDKRFHRTINRYLRMGDEYTLLK